MDTKLTLKLDKEVIDRAKIYAKQHQVSLSRMIEAYLDRLTKKEKKDAELLTPLVQSLFGVATLPEGIDEKEAYFEFLAEKHSLKDAA